MMMSLKGPEGLPNLLRLLEERAGAIADPPPLPQQFGDMHEWREWCHEGGDGYFDPDEPCTGFFRMRLVRGGPWVPVAIFIEDDEWLAWVDDELWPIGGRLVYPRMITEARFLAMHRERLDALRARQFHHWRLRTRTPIDMTRI